MRPPCTPLPGRANLFAAPRTAPSTPISRDDVNYGPRAAGACSLQAAGRVADVGAGLPTRIPHATSR